MNLRGQGEEKEKRSILLMFSSDTAMSLRHPDSRPVPAEPAQLLPDRVCEVRLAQRKLMESCSDRGTIVALHRAASVGQCRLLSAVISGRRTTGLLLFT